MSIFQQPSNNGKWLCNKCHIHSMNTAVKCSWCGAARPQPAPPPPPPVIKESEEKPEPVVYPEAEESIIIPENTPKKPQTTVDKNLEELSEIMNGLSEEERNELIELARALAE